MVICSSVFSLNCENKTEQKKIEKNVWSHNCKNKKEKKQQ
jgi:hypothetical protein